MFETLNGTATSVSATQLTDSALSNAIDFYKNWKITVNGVEYSITSNTITDFLFQNSLTGTPVYKVEFMTRDFLSKIDDQILNTNLVPVSLIQNKINITKLHLEEKIYAYMRNKFAEFDDPFSLILNLYHIQLPFAYYCLAEIFSDLLLTGQDINGYKEEKYRSAYKDLIKDALSLLSIDENQSGDLTKDEKISSPGNGGYFSR